MTTQKEKLRSLTWGYFWKRKGNEALWILLILGAIFILPFAAGMMYCSAFPDTNWGDWNATGDDLVCDSYLSLFQFGMWLLIAISIITIIILGVIKWNWVVAEQDARRQLEDEE